MTLDELLNAANQLKGRCEYCSNRFLAGLAQNWHTAETLDFPLVQPDELRSMQIIKIQRSSFIKAQAKFSNYLD